MRFGRILTNLRIVQNKDRSKTETIKESEEMSVNDGDGWLEVGPKNRTSTVRTVSPPARCLTVLEIAMIDTHWLLILDGNIRISY
jgi:hypothetical protein